MNSRPNSNFLVYVNKTSLGAREPCISLTAFELWSSGLCLFWHVNIQKVSSAVALSTNLGAHPSRDWAAWLSRDKDMFLIMRIRAIWRRAAADNPYAWGNISVRQKSNTSSGDLLANLTGTMSFFPCGIFLPAWRTTSLLSWLKMCALK